MRRFRPDRDKIGVVQAKARGSAYFDGLMRCGRVWVCPVCASKISEARRAELNELLLSARIIVSHGEAQPASYYPRWFLTMLTFTIQHKPHESFADVLARLNRAWTRYTSGRWMQQFRARFFITGTLRALETTHGAEGWHPHYHLLQFHDSMLRPYTSVLNYYPSQAEMIGHAQARWSNAVFSIGGYAHASIGVGLTVGDVQQYPIKSDAERELKRWGMTSEITKQPSKRAKLENRSLTELLIDAAKGDDLAAHLWTEAVIGLARQKQLEPSKGLWLMLGRTLKSEEEAAEDEAEPSDKVLASLTWAQWRKVLHADARGELLDIASRGDEAELWSFLASLGVERDD